MLYIPSTPEIQIIPRIIMAAPAPNADPAAVALTALAIALCQADAAACEAAAMQLRDTLTKTSDDAQDAVCLAVASSVEVVAARRASAP